MPEQLVEMLHSVVASVFVVVVSVAAEHTNPSVPCYLKQLDPLLWIGSVYFPKAGGDTIYIDKNSH